MQQSTHHMKLPLERHVHMFVACIFLDWMVFWWW